MDTDCFSELMKRQTALAFFNEGKLYSGMAAHWLGMPRGHFLLQAMQEGSAALLENNDDDFARETVLL